MLKNWEYRSDTDVFVREHEDKNRMALKVVTREEFENNKGKYTYPTDELLDAIYNILHIVESLKG